MKTLFGFGSLISLESLQTSAPDVLELLPVYIKGYKRDFSVWDPLGFTKTHPDIKGIGFCALDVKKSLDIENRVNGVLFSVSDDAFEEIKIREQEYKLVSEKCYDFHTDKTLGECYFFSANKNNGIYTEGCVAQERYLETCLIGAKEHGEKFYKQFLETTYIGNKTLKEYV